MSNLEIKAMLGLMSEGYEVKQASNMLQAMKNYNVQLDKEEKALKEVCVGMVIK